MTAVCGLWHVLCRAVDKHAHRTVHAVCPLVVVVVVVCATHVRLDTLGNTSVLHDWVGPHASLAKGSPFFNPLLMHGQPPPCVEVLSLWWACGVSGAHRLR